MTFKFFCSDSWIFLNSILHNFITIGKSCFLDVTWICISSIFSVFLTSDPLPSLLLKFSFFKTSSLCVCVCVCDYIVGLNVYIWMWVFLGKYSACMLSCFSHVWLFLTPWTVADQAPLSMRFSRQEYWDGFHALFQRIFLTRGLNLHPLCLLHWQAASLPLPPPGYPKMYSDHWIKKWKHRKPYKVLSR